MKNASSRSLSVIAAVLAAGLTAGVAQAETYPPARNADTFAPPQVMASPATSCTATGVWDDGFGTGSGSWSRIAKRRCHPPGIWTDAYGYTWKVKTGASAGTLVGSGNYNNIPACKIQVWPLTGLSTGKNFTVTATNPNGGSDGCATYFKYTLKIH